MTPNDRDDDPFDDLPEPGEVEPEIGYIEIEEPEDEEPGIDEQESEGTGKTPASLAVAAESPDRRAELLDLAHRLDIRSDDPAWLLVRAALDAQGAATTATEAAHRLEDVPGAIARAALTGASNAASEIRQHAAAGAETIAATLGSQIEAAAAEPLRKALKPYLRDLSKEAGDVRTAIREQTGYRVDRLVNGFLERAGRELDRRSIATKTAGRVSAILLLILGAVLGVAGAKFDHHLSPTAVHASAGGGYSIVVPKGYDGRFKRCGKRGNSECVDLYPPKPPDKKGRE